MTFLTNQWKYLYENFPSFVLSPIKKLIGFVTGSSEYYGWILRYTEMHLGGARDHATDAGLL